MLSGRTTVRFIVGLQSLASSGFARRKRLPCQSYTGVDVV
jgi:hypothetical protein